MTLEELEQVIAARASADPSESWTARLLAKGPEKCAEKFGEEAVEAVIEAVRGDAGALTAEAAGCCVSPSCDDACAWRARGRRDG